MRYLLPALMSLAACGNQGRPCTSPFHSLTMEDPAAECYDPTAQLAYMLAAGVELDMNRIDVIVVPSASWHIVGGAEVAGFTVGNVVRINDNGWSLVHELMHVVTWNERLSVEHMGWVADGSYGLANFSQFVFYAKDSFMGSDDACKPPMLEKYREPLMAAGYPVEKWEARLSSFCHHGASPVGEK